MKILYIEDNIDIQELYSSILGSTLQLPVINSTSEADAIKQLENDPDIRIIITDLILEVGNGINIYKYLEEQGLIGEIFFVFLSGYSKEDILDEIPNFETITPYNMILGKPVSHEAFEGLKEYIPVTVTEEESYPGYVSVKGNLIFYSKQVATNIYLKLNADKHICIFKQGDNITKEDVQKYQDKIKDNFYVKKEDFAIFSAHYLKIASKLIAKHKNKPIDESFVESAFDVHELIQKRIVEVGIDEEVIATTKVMVLETLNKITADKELGPFIEKMYNKGKFLYEHSLMLNYFTFLVMDKLDWNSFQTQYKISLACLFHDISLPDKFDFKELEQKNMNKKILKQKFKLYFSHPLDSSILVSQLKDLPPDTGVIISHHHESPDGTGFPIGLDAFQVFPLSCLFNSCHYLLMGLYHEEFAPGAASTIVKKMKETHNKGNYAKIYKAMVETFCD